MMEEEIEFMQQVCHSCPTRGFTLIEMLVVVIIIAILAAIALPQYQKVVARTRMMDFVAQARILRQALIMYQLSNGQHITSLNDLDIWDKVTTKNNITNWHLGENQYHQQGDLYIYVTISIPGYRSPLCWFNWSGTKGFCRMYDDKGAALAESLGWEVCVSNKYNIYPYCGLTEESYHIGKAWGR